MTGPKGPEAGVWVIAETTDLPTKYAKIVVTDDQGRYVLPDLPKAKYKVWVRGYGLVNSAKVDAEPGRQLNLTRGGRAEREARRRSYYPPIYWYSMLRDPGEERIPRHRPEGQRHQSRRSARSTIGSPTSKASAVSPAMPWARPARA